MAIDVEIKAKGMGVDDRLNDYITSKADKLDRYISDLEVVRVELTHAKTARQATDRFVTQLTLHGKRMVLRAEERADDIYASFDLALDKLQRQMERYKSKRRRGRGDGVSIAEAMMEPTDDLDDFDDQEFVIARRKKFTLIPMDELEAIEQSGLLDHEEFFVFYNMDTNSVNVLYKRRDGTYGLIDTEVG